MNISFFMVFDITQLKNLRRHLNLTQQQFAKQAGISQSMVAKIESGRLDPTYSYVKKIEETLAKLTHHEEQEAKEIMQQKIIVVSKDQIVRNVLGLFSRHKISQIPVMDKRMVVGLLTEKDLLQDDLYHLNDKHVGDIMTESPPLLSKTTKVSVLRSLLMFYPILLVQERGKIVGCITKADLLKNMK